MKIFSGSINTDFAKRVCKHLNTNLGNLKHETFKDGEVRIIIDESIRQEDCFVIQPTCRNYEKGKSVNDAIIELLIIVDALKRGSAKTVNVVIPYFGYQRQDRKDYSRAPISASVMARCLESQNINRVIVYDLHAGQISGFFSNNCPLDNLYAEPYFIEYINEKIIGFKNIDKSDLILVSPDEGGIKTNIRVASKLGCEAATIFKNRGKDCEINTMKLMGNVKDKNVIMIDDIIDSAGTACKACQLLKDNGAKDIYFFASHGLLSGNADEKISNSHFTKVIITNIVPNKFSNDSKIEIIDVSWLCSEAIRRVQIGQSLKSLYDDGDFIYKLKFV